MKTSSQLIDLDSHSAQNTSDFFGLGKVSDLKPVGKGKSNKNYFVKTNTGDYVFRMITDFTPDTLMNEVSIQEQLKAGEVLTSHFLRNKGGEYVFCGNNSFTTASDKLAGKNPEGVLSEKICFAIGRTLARFHTTVLELPTENTGSLLSPSHTTTRAHNLIDSEEKYQILTLLGYGNEILEDDIPKGVVHGDLHRENILINSDHEGGNVEIAVLDMEQSTLSYYIYDIARSIIDICRDGSTLRMNSIQSFLAGYDQIRTLSPAERKKLPLAINFSCATVALWCHERGYKEFVDLFLTMQIEK